MTDRELLGLAAKAAGIDARWFDSWRGFFIYEPIKTPIQWKSFDPLTDDADSLRLAVKLGIGVLFDLQDEKVTAYQQEPRGGYYVEFADEQEPSAATRRAIVRAAAEIGKAMP
jgi:hypothetical protein